MFMICTSFFNRVRSSSAIRTTSKFHVFVRHNSLFTVDVMQTTFIGQLIFALETDDVICRYIMVTTGIVRYCEILCQKWTSREAESNHRPKDHCVVRPLQSSALPTELSRVTIAIILHDIPTIQKCAKNIVYEFIFLRLSFCKICSINL